VPYTGIVGIDATFDHAGPMARTAADVALLLEVIAGKDPMDPRQSDVPVKPYTQMLTKDLRGLRIGKLWEGFGTPLSDPDVDSKVRRAVEAMRELGAQVEEVSVAAHLEAGGIIWALIAEGMAALMHGNGVGYHWKGLYNESLANTIGKSLQAQAQDLPAQVKFALLVGSYLKSAYHGRLYAKAQNQRRVLQEAYDRVLRQADVLVMPSTPMTAHRYNPEQTVSELIDHGWNMLANTAP
jgi:amidase